MGIHTQKQYTAFNGGSISPRVFGQTDFGKYDFSLAGCENLLLWIQGPASRRSGLRFVHAVKDAAQTQRLIEFRFNRTQTYIIEFGPLYMRYYTNQGIIETTPGSGIPFELTTAFTQDQVNELDFAQVNDVMYLVHPDKKPSKLSRVTDTNWTLLDMVIRDGPWEEVNTDQDNDIGIVIDSPSPGIHTVTFAKSTVAVGDLGRLFRNLTTNGNAPWSWATITNVLSTTVMEVTPNEFNLNDHVSQSGIKDWRLGSWSDTLGWPGKITLHQNRSVFAGSTRRPQTLYFTESGDFESFAPTNAAGDIVDSSGFDYTLTDDTLNIVQWMKSLDTLFIGTTEGEFIIQGGDNQVLTPTSTSSARMSNYGSESVRPPIAMNSLMFVQRAGRKIREITQALTQSQSEAPDLTKLADHLTLSGIVDMAYQQEPNSMLWCAKTNGELISLTFDKSEKVFGWGNHPIGGTDAKILSIAAIEAGATGQTTFDGSARVKRDELWAVVGRTINSISTKYVEFMEEEWDHDSANEDFLFFDSGLSYSGPAITAVSGLSHLEGELVGIIADGSVVTPQLVSGGQITLSKAASKIHIGLKYKSKLESLDLEQPLPDGSSVGRQKRINAISVRFFRTLSAKFGEKGGTIEDVIFRTSGSPTGVQITPVSGVKNLNVQGSYDGENRVIVETDEGLPMTISSIVVRMETNAAVN